MDGRSTVHGASPNGACIISTHPGAGFENPPGVSWIAPLEPGAEWTEVPVEINGWLDVPTAPAPTSGAPTPAATPAPDVGVTAE